MEKRLNQFEANGASSDNCSKVKNKALYVRETGRTGPFPLGPKGTQRVFLLQCVRDTKPAPADGYCPLCNWGIPVV